MCGIEIMMLSSVTLLVLAVAIKQWCDVPPEAVSESSLSSSSSNYNEANKLIEDGRGHIQIHTQHAGASEGKGPR